MKERRRVCGVVVVVKWNEDVWWKERNGEVIYIVIFDTR